MLKKFFKWTGMVLASLLVLTIVVIGSLYIRGNARLTKKYEIQPESLVIPTDQASVELGKKWAAVLCADCHGADFSGKPLVDDKTVGFVPAPNLTSGEGGAGGEFTDADWVRTLRDGVDPEGRALIGMPSMNFNHLTDKDLAAIIAYLKTVPSIDHEMGEPRLSTIGKIMLAAGGFGKNILPAEVINHTISNQVVISDSSVFLETPSAEYGNYLVRVIGCRDCHGQDLAGGKSPAPNAPFAPNLISTGIARTWSEESFITAARTNISGDMPWAMLQPLNDTELESIFEYLKSLP